MVHFYISVYRDFQQPGGKKHQALVIDRKNFLFASTPRGAGSSAVMFSMIQTAIENHLDPYRYLTWLLKTANEADLTDSETVERLLPWNAPDGCRTI